MAASSAPTDPSKPTTLSDVAYTAVGFAVLTFQRVQVARNEMRRELSSIASSITKHGAELVNERRN